MNKTKLLALASAVTVTAVSVFASNASAVQMPMLGDMDNSGKVGASDARTKKLINRFYWLLTRMATAKSPHPTREPY